MANLPKNAHVSQHPCLQAKLSQLRSASTSPKDVQSLVHDIALMVGYEALAQGLQAHPGDSDKSPLGYTYTTTTTSRPSPSGTHMPTFRPGSTPKLSGWLWLSSRSPLSTPS